MDDPKAVFEKLAGEFPAQEVKWRVEALSKDKRRALIVPYVDARIVADRLDEVVGHAGWHDQYDLLALKQGDEPYAVMCRLTVKGVTKQDVGEGDSLKAAFSDAFKRAAVKFGIGRYLYTFNKVWADHDPDRGTFTIPEELGGGVSDGSGATRPAGGKAAASAKPRPPAQAQGSALPKADSFDELGQGEAAGEVEALIPAGSTGLAKAYNYAKVGADNRWGPKRYKALLEAFAAKFPKVPEDKRVEQLHRMASKVLGVEVTNLVEIDWRDAKKVQEQLQ